MKATEMMKSGAVLTVLTGLTTVLSILTIGDFVFGLSEYPAWAPHTNTSQITSKYDCF